MAALSQDLRERVIDAVLIEGMSRRAAAARFGVSQSSAIKWVERVERTGSRVAGKVGGRKPMMLETHRAFIEARRQEKPDITLQGLCDRLQAERGVKAYPSVMSRFLRHIGVTLKKRRSLPASRTEPTSAAIAGAGSIAKGASLPLASSSSTRHGQKPT